MPALPELRPRRLAELPSTPPTCFDPKSNQTEECLLRGKPVEGTIGSCIEGKGCRYKCYTKSKKEDLRRAAAFVMSGQTNFNCLTTLDCKAVVVSWTGPTKASEWCHSKFKSDAAVEMQSLYCKEVCLKPGFLWLIPVYIIGMLYMFMGLAVICDEFFVPSLEKFVEDLGLSNDVAGATFMAAGGSMPELITSFIGTFRENTIGVSAIVGSAVFNVLFVIGVCGLASNETLKLSWWPLARDICCYLVTLVTLVAFFKWRTPGQIEAWEAAVLFCEYLCYCTFMFRSRNVQIWVFKKLGLEPPADSDDECDLSAVHPAGASTVYNHGDSDDMNNPEVHIEKPSTFRVGIFQLLTQGRHISETVGVHTVTMIKGNLEQSFKSLDQDGDNFLDNDEIMKLLSQLGLKENSAEAVSLQQELKCIAPRTIDGKICFEAFKKWYISSEARVGIEMHRVFKRFDKNNSGTIERDEIKCLLKHLGHHHIDESELDASINEILTASAHATCTDSLAVIPDYTATKSGFTHDDLQNVHISYEQFEAWYTSSLFWQAQHNRHQIEAAVDDEGYSIECPIEWPPQGNGERWQCLLWACFYPLAAAMYVSVPDVRHPRYNNFRWAVVSFSCSLAWIMLLSFLLYEWLSVVSNTVGLPTNIAALTLLAGGTSIPDLLSSWVVARQGHGDMAVSSSIGSNIFDVTVGLPVPWLIYCAVNSDKGYVTVESNSIYFSLLLLICMLGAITAVIAGFGWEMSRRLGGIMMVLYVVFLILSIMKETKLIPDF